MDLPRPQHVVTLSALSGRADGARQLAGRLLDVKLCR